MPLYQIKKRSNCMIEDVPDVKTLDSLGLRKGATVKVVTRQPFGGPVVVQLGRRNIAVSREVASKIEIKEV